MQSVFFVFVILISIENFYLVEKQNNENVVSEFVKTCDELVIDFGNLSKWLHSVSTYPMVLEDL